MMKTKNMMTTMMTTDNDFSKKNNQELAAWTARQDISKFDIWVTWVGLSSKTSKTDFCNKFQSEFEQHHIQVFLLMVFTCPNPNPTLLERYIAY